jgi:toxin ParE1/3/4
VPAFRLSAAADADLREIAAYTKAQWGTVQRDTYLRELFGAFEDLAVAPEIAVAIDHVREGYRKHPCGSHVIFFRRGDDGVVEVIRVLHRRMDIDTQLKNA